MRIRLLLAAVIVALVTTGSVAAREPSHVTYAPVPPGTVVQNQVVSLGGAAMHAQWRAIASKSLVGSDGSQKFYQWYLSIYRLDGTTYRLAYRSPQDGGPLATVEQAHGAKLWFPVAEMKIVGAAQLMRPGVQQLVVQSHEAAADCGNATVAIFGANAHGNVVPVVSVGNGCDLSASIVHASAGDTLRLEGPYYAANAPRCCPTKPRASAVLRYAGGVWKASPNYFQLAIGKLPPA